MGGLISSYVSLSTKVVLTIDESTFDLQASLFDAIMPNLLPLAVTLGVFSLLRKEKFTSLQIMLGIIVIGFILGLAGIC